MEFKTFKLLAFGVTLFFRPFPNVAGKQTSGNNIGVFRIQEIWQRLTAETAESAEKDENKRKKEVKY